MCRLFQHLCCTQEPELPAQHGHTEATVCGADRPEACIDDSTFPLVHSQKGDQILQSQLGFSVCTGGARALQHMKHDQCRAQLRSLNLLVHLPCRLQLLDLAAKHAMDAWVACVAPGSAARPALA